MNAELCEKFKGRMENGMCVMGERPDDFSKSIFINPEKDIRWKMEDVIGLVWMSPDDFLSKVPNINPTREEFPFEEFIKMNPGSTREEYEEMMKRKPNVRFYARKANRGEKVSLPIIDISSGRYGCKNEWSGHEGRHRSYLAKRRGEKAIPILVFWWHGDRNDEHVPGILNDIKTSKQGDCWLGLNQEEIIEDIQRVHKLREWEVKHPLAGPPNETKRG